MKKFPSVTQVISPYQDFSKVPPDILAAAQDRGKQIHQICAAIALDLWVPDIPVNCQGYVDSFKYWLDSAVEEIIWVEKELIHPVHCYKGRPDALIRFKGDRGLALPDWKTPLALYKIWRLQISAYRELVEINESPVERVGSLRLHPDGKAAKFEEYTGTMAYDLSVFLNALSVYKFMKGGK